MREDWKEVRLKDITILNPSINEEFKELVSFIPMENLRNGFINYSDVIQFQEAKGKYTYFSNGDLLIAKVTPCFENGNIAIAKKLFNKKGFGSSEIFVLRTLKNISEYFLFYYCQSISFREKAISTMYGVAGLKRIPSLFMRTYSLHLPPITTQRAIANYLGEKSAVIDRHILLLEKKRKRYTALRKSLINKTVRYGLNPDVELKDSGIEWLGKIPKHWEVKRVKEISKVESSGIDKKIVEGEELIKIVNYVDVYNNQRHELYNSDDYMVVSASIEKTKSKKLKKGDMLITPSSETVEDIGISSVVMEDLNETLFSYHILRIQFSQNIDINFKKYVFNNTFVQNYFSSTSTGTTRRILSLSKIYNLQIPIPPLSEQQTIAHYLDAQSEKIDRIVANINMQLGKLTKLKKSLINECVTGERIIQI